MLHRASPSLLATTKDEENEKRASLYPDDKRVNLAISLAKISSFVGWFANWKRKGVGEMDIEKWGLKRIRNPKISQILS